MSGPRLHRLANGGTVICDPVPGYETVALSVVAGRGARWEDGPRSGWSHLLEHMVFKGAGGRSARALAEAIESGGGQINAATGHERTSFQVRALKGGLPLAMEICADLLRRPHLDPEDLEREKHVVGQEIAEAADTPDDHVFELAQAAAFPGQPLGRSILGETHTLQPAAPAALEDWRARLYGPDRLVVSAAGSVDEDELLSLAERAFADTPVRPIAEPEPAQFAGGRAVERRRLEQAHLVFLLPGPGVADDSAWAARLLAEILGGGMSSRLFQEARERLGLAYAIDSFCETWDGAGLIGVYAGCGAADAGRLAQVVAGELCALAKGPTEAELARARAQLKAGLFMGRESLAGRAEQSAAQWLAFGRLLPAREIAERIDAVDGEAVAEAAASLLTAGRSAVACLGPARSETAADRFERALAG